MNQRFRPVAKRLFRALAWITLVFCVFVVVTGTIVGMGGDSVAQEDEQQVAEQQVAEQQVDRAADQARQ
ncbi:MAG: hypothetical protein ACLFVJ_22600, partial [Persicimonas sp.]